MTGIPNDEVPALRKGKEQAPPAVADAPAKHQHEITYVSGMAGIEGALDGLADVVARLTSYEHAINVCSGYGVSPLKITLAANDEDDVLDRLVTGVERIADSLAKLAGLNRPRLESWQEQDGYEPRYRDIACDGGAPGPKDKAEIA